MSVVFEIIQHDFAGATANDLLSADLPSTEPLGEGGRCRFSIRNAGTATAFVLETQDLGANGGTDESAHEIPVGGTLVTIDYQWPLIQVLYLRGLMGADCYVTPQTSLY